MSVRAFVKTIVIVVLFVLLISVLVPLAMRAIVQRNIFEAPDNVPQTDAALVLGASVVRGKPSPVLEERAHTAVALYMMGKVTKILVTGDNGALTHDEVTPVRKYLIDAGVKPEDIFLDHAGFDTYSSMYRARDVFLADSVTIVTQDFHMPRAVFVARSLGINAYGVVPERGQGDMYDYIREIPASMKALIDLAIKRSPKYLGNEIPLTGDGQSTWY
ncbi:MAG: YdcF family protein [Candidatus Pacebacteria bacterium]|nr:YdcF family protein [Candidatus Paceibacterota bacterium]